MRKDTILETIPMYENEVVLTGTVTMVAGANTLVGVGTLFLTELANGSVIGLIDDAGEIMYYTIATRADNTNAVIEGTAKAASTGAAYYLQDLETPYIIGADPLFATAFPTKIPIYDTLRNDLVTGEYTISGTPDKWINANEGVLLKSIYAVLPYQYTFADSNIGVLLRYHRYNVASYSSVLSIGNDGAYFLPFENSEIEVNEYIPSPQSLTTPLWAGDAYWGLSIDFASAPESQAAIPAIAAPDFGNKYTWVSIVNEPAVLDRKLMPVKLGVRIKHGLAMTGV